MVLMLGGPFDVNGAGSMLHYTYPVTTVEGRILFTSDLGVGISLYILEEGKVKEVCKDCRDGRWSRDGNNIVYFPLGDGNFGGILEINVRTGSKNEILRSTEHPCFYPFIQVMGKIFYVSEHREIKGVNNLFVINAKNGIARQLMSNKEGSIISPKFPRMGIE